MTRLIYSRLDNTRRENNGLRHQRHSRETDTRPHAAADRTNTTTTTTTTVSLHTFTLGASKHDVSTTQAQTTRQRALEYRRHQLQGHRLTRCLHRTQEDRVGAKQKKKTYHTHTHTHKNAHRTFLDPSPGGDGASRLSTPPSPAPAPPPPAAPPTRPPRWGVTMLSRWPAWAAAYPRCWRGQNPHRGTKQGGDGRREKRERPEYLETAAG